MARPHPTRRERRAAAGFARPAPRAVAPPTALQAELSDGFLGGGNGGGGGYQGAWNTDQRGWVYWPFHRDPEREIDAFSRDEIARKAHWAAGNLGLGRRIKLGLTMLAIGEGLTPKGTTRDREWNHLAQKVYNRRALGPATYDVRARLDAALAQRLLYATGLVDGDAVVVRSQSESGGALRAFYSGLQVSNRDLDASAASAPDSRWRDGLYLDALNRTAAYRFPAREIGQPATVVPADRCAFFCRYETLGQLRGMSIFAHAIPKIQDKAEVEAATMKNVKSSAQMGFFLKKDVSAPQQSDMKTRVQTGGVNRSVIPPGSTRAITQKVVFGTGGDIADLPPGYDLKMLLDERPHPNTAEFVWEFLRDIAHGCGIHPEILWNIGKLGGASVRYVLAELQQWIQVEQRNFVRQVLSPDWIFTIACEMQAGRLRRCEDPEWWRNAWIPPERTTVDIGRDGRIMLEQYRAGLITDDRWFARQGLDAREEWENKIEFAAWRKQLMADSNVTWSDLCAPTQLTLSEPAAVASSNPSAPTNPEGDDGSDETV